MLELLCEYHPHCPNEVFNHVIARGEGVVVEFSSEDFPFDTVHTGTYSCFVDHMTQEELQEQRLWMKAQAAKAKIQNEATFKKLKAIRPVWKAILEANDAYYTQEQADKVFADIKKIKNVMDYIRLTYVYRNAILGATASTRSLSK